MKHHAPGALTGTLSYLMASAFWGLNIPLTAVLLESMDPFWIPPCRYLIAATVLGLWLAVSAGPAQLRRPVALTRVLPLSLAVALFLVSFNLGLRDTHPITAAAVMAGSPVYVAIVSRLITGARLEKGFWGAALLTVAGAGIAIGGRAGATGFTLSGGEFWLVASIMFWTLYSIYAQRWFPASVSQLRRTYMTTVWALPWLLVFWALARAAGLAGAPNLDPSASALWILLVTAVFSSALAVVAWNTGVARLGVNAGALWQNMVPVFAVLISLLFFGVVPSVHQVIGGLVVLSGVMFMHWRRRYGR